MLRFLVRLLGYAAVAGGFVALVVDGARMIANSAFQLTPLGETLQALLGERYGLMQPAIERSLHPLLWDPGLLAVLKLPTAAVGLVLGLALVRLGARPHETIGVVTRR